MNNTLLKRGLIVAVVCIPLAFAAGWYLSKRIIGQQIQKQMQQIIAQGIQQLPVDKSGVVQSQFSNMETPEDVKAVMGILNTIAATKDIKNCDTVSDPGLKMVCQNYLATGLFKETGDKQYCPFIDPKSSDGQKCAKL